MGSKSGIKHSQTPDDGLLPKKDCFGSHFLAHRLWRITEANDAYETQCESVRAKYMIFVDFCFVISYHCIIKDGARHARFLGIRI